MGEPVQTFQENKAVIGDAIIMNKEGTIVKVGEICFWTGILIELIIVIIDKSAYINPYESMLFRLTFVLFCIKIATTKYSRCEWLCMIAVGGIAVISYFINERDEAVRAVALVAACKDIDLKKLLTMILGITALGSVVLFVLSATGIFGSISVTANFGRGPSPGIVETRYCFGMGHPNAFQGMLFMISTLVLYLYAERMKLIHFAALMGVNLVFFFFTDSNTAILVMTVTIMGVIFMKYCKPLSGIRGIYIAGAACFIIIVLFSLYGASVGVQNAFMYKLDKLLNGRFKYAYTIEQARLQNWSLFADAANQEYFDQGFIRLFYWYGIIPSLVYLFGNLYLIWHAYQKSDYCLLVIVVAYAVYSLMEAHLVSVYLLRNYLFIWFGCYWYQPFAERQQKEFHFWQIKKLIGK